MNSAGTTVKVEATNVSSEDSGGAAGWSLADAAAFYQQSVSAWHDSTNAMLMEVKGFNAVAPVRRDYFKVHPSRNRGRSNRHLHRCPGYCRGLGDVTIAVTETSADISLSATTLTCRHRKLEHWPRP